ncbi:MAG TPA: serine/threonine-protein kinase [Verrucomicrobiae bacterium]|nr:serine/threonine-protein kinase [Verrucomicrobiae bacterium]
MPEPNKCPQCSTPLPSGALAGLCPACLLKMGAAADTVTDAKQPPFLPPSVAELVPLFPQLEILELIGKGGMGAVYKARQKQLDRIVALKILPPGIGHDAAFAERFAREAKALAKLNHPNIVTLYEFGDAGGQFYFLMEFVDGVNLRQLLQAGRISAREALAIVPQICDALQFAHDQGIVHRDIKPENILLDRRGRVKVADFGLAKIVESRDDATNLSASEKNPENLTDGGKTMGTPNYMSPEQIAAPGEVDNRADIYALGVVFYQMLTGELPGKKIEPPSKKVQIDVRLDEIVLRALEKNPELRFQQVGEVKTCVETIVSENKKSEVGSQKPEGKLRFQRTAIGVIVALMVILAVLAFIYFQPVKSDSLPNQPTTNTAMKTNPSKLHTVAVLVAGIVSLQATNMANAQHIDPANGLPVSQMGDLPPEASINIAYSTQSEVHTLIANGQYDEALQRCLSFHSQIKNNVNLVVLLTDWSELGRRFPKAKEALIEIRDHDVQEFSEGSGYFDLFQEIKVINDSLHQDDSTYALFKVIREKDPSLAQQCFFSIEGLLVAKGEYQWYYEQISGDPQGKFDSIRQFFTMQIDQQKRMAELNQKTTQRIAEMNHKNGITNSWSPPDTSAMMKKNAENGFVGQTRQLIEVLVATDHKAAAEKIRDEAMTVLDDSRLQSAVADAEQKLKK